MAYECQIKVIDEEVKGILEHLICGVIERARDDSRIGELSQLKRDSVHQISQLFPKVKDNV